MSCRQSFGTIKMIIYEWVTAIPHLITPLQTAKCRSPTHCFDSVSFGWPQRPAHPRFPQHLQVIGIALHEQHVVLQPSLEGNFRHRFHESFIPEASRILRLKIRKHVLSVSVARAEFDVLVPAENNSERRGWQLDRAVLYRHFCLHMNLNLHVVLRMRHHNSVYLIQQLSLSVTFLESRTPPRMSRLGMCMSVSTGSQGNRRCWRTDAGEARGTAHQWKRSFNYMGVFASGLPLKRIYR